MTSYHRHGKFCSSVLLYCLNLLVPDNTPLAGAIFSTQSILFKAQLFGMLILPVPCLCSIWESDTILNTLLFSLGWRSRRWSPPQSYDSFYLGGNNLKGYVDCSYHGVTNTKPFFKMPIFSISIKERSTAKQIVILKMKQIIEQKEHKIPIQESDTHLHNF